MGQGSGGAYASRTREDPALRVAVLDGGAGEVVERLLQQATISQRHEVADPGPMPLKDFRATLSVEAVDASSSRVVWHAEFAPTGISAADAEAAVVGVFDVGLERLATDA